MPPSSLPSRLWEVRATAHKGLGVFAKLPIPRGTRIFSEPPLLAIRQDQDASSIYPSALLLEEEDRKRLLGLSTYVTRESRVIRWLQAGWWTLKSVTGLGRGKGKATLSERWNVKQHVQMLSVFRNNAFALGEGGIGQAVFRGISRINHSCVPNSQGNFHAGMGKFNIHATRDIAIDEEVTVSYLPEHGSMRAVRLEKLREGYGFDCGCSACDNSKDDGVSSEGRRAHMQNLMEDFAKFSAKQETIKEPLIIQTSAELEAERRKDLEIERTKEEMAVRVLQAYIQTWEDDGIAGREVASS
jgi:hypothetical protein